MNFDLMAELSINGKINMQNRGVIMRLNPAKSILLGAIVTITILGISMLAFYSSWISGVANFTAPLLGGFTASYFTKKRIMRYGACAGIISGIIFASILILFENIPADGIIIALVSFSILFGVLAGIGGLIGEITDENRRHEIKTGRRDKPPSNVIYCPQCGLKDLDNSTLCISCGEDLESIRNYLKKTRYLLYISIGIALMFIISLIIAVNETSTANYSSFTVPIILFILIFIPVIIGKLILTPPQNHASKYCPKCENKDYNKKYCIKCGYNLENVLGCFSGNIGVDLYDIELNKNYINLYRHIIERSPDGPGEYHERLPPKTILLGNIRNMHISKCKTLIVFTKPCLKFDYWGGTVEFKMDKKTIDEVNKILSTGVYDDLISRDDSINLK